jgi:hypothetical protein
MLNMTNSYPKNSAGEQVIAADASCASSVARFAIR